MNKKITDEDRKRTMNEEFGRLKDIAVQMQLHKYYNKDGGILAPIADAERNGLLYVFEQSHGKDISSYGWVPLVNADSPLLIAQGKKQIILTDETDPMKLCKMYHKAETDKEEERKDFETVFSSLGHHPEGDLAFVSGLGCICGSSVPDFDNLGRLAHYGEVFCSVDLKGCSIEYLEGALSLKGNAAKEYLAECKETPISRERVSDFTSRYNSRDKKSLPADLVSQVHLIPVVPSWRERE